jgi:hypothetical protein
MPEEPSATLLRPDRNGRVYFIVGLVFALIIWGLQLIGVTVNVYLGGFVLAVAFVLMVCAFWIWERTSTWHVFLRIGTIFVAAVIYSLVIGKQMIFEWQKEHTMTAAKAPATAPESQLNPKPGQPATIPSTAIPKESAKTSPKTKHLVVQENNGGSNNTNTQVGAVQGPTAIAPNGIANAAPNFGNQNVNNYAPPQRSLTPDQRRTFISVLQKTCPFEVAVRGVPGNPESMNFGDELAKAIKDAGCTLRRPKFLIDTSAGYGIWVMLHDKENIPAGADALINALTQAGLTPKSNTLDAIEPGVVYLMIAFNDK